MLKLDPVKSEKVWGYELWIASTHPNGPQKEFVKAVGDYPLLVKIIQADDTLSVQVHPDDKKAVELEGPDARGKTECWYVLDAKPGAKLVYGLKKDYKKEELKALIEDKNLESALNSVEVHKGDFIFIPSGTVHAIGGGLRLLEVQQSCDITYRLYDWGRPREIHVEKALESVKSLPAKKIEKFPGEFECQYFSLEEVKVQGGYSYLASKADGWQLVYVLEGSGKIHSTDANGKSPDEAFKAEEIFACAPGDKITIEGACHLMKIKAK